MRQMDVQGTEMGWRRRCSRVHRLNTQKRLKKPLLQMRDHTNHTSCALAMYANRAKCVLAETTGITAVAPEKHSQQTKD